MVEWLPSLPRWERRGRGLHRELSFRDFTEAFGFMTMVALVAERLNHHPDWSNSWNKVVLDVTNHAATGLTEIDFELANAIDKALGEH